MELIQYGQSYPLSMDMRRQSWHEARFGMIANLSMPGKGCETTVGTVGWWFSSTINFASSGLNPPQTTILVHLPLLENTLVFLLFRPWRVNVSYRQIIFAQF